MGKRYRMDSARWKDDRMLGAQIAMAAVGAGALCVYHRSWVDAAHVMYDVPAGLTVFGFAAQLVVEFDKEGAHRFWLYRIALFVAMSVVTVGRQYWYWPISGHLSCVLAVALVQTVDPRLPWFERLLYWAPVPIVLYLRLAVLEQGHHWGTYNGLLFAFVAAAPGMMLAYANRSALMGEAPIDRRAGRHRIGEETAVRPTE